MTATDASDLPVLRTDALAAQSRGEVAIAHALFERLLTLAPDDFVALYSLAVMEANAGRHAAALPLIERAVAVNPSMAQAHLAHSVIAFNLGRLDVAEKAAATALRLRPDDMGAVAQRELLRRAGRGDTAGRDAPADIAAAIARASELAARGQRNEAMAVYRLFIQSGDPAFRYIAFFNLGVLCAEANLNAEAEAYFRQSQHLNGQFFLTHINLGTLAEAQGRPEEAVAIWEAALGRPEIDALQHLDTKLKLLNNLGRLLEIRRDYDRAEAALLRSLHAEPRQAAVLHHWVHLRQKQCKWPVSHGIDLTHQEIKDAASPLAMLGLSESPAEQLASARRFVAEKVGKFPRLVSADHRYGHERVRIGYLSSDLSMHAVSMLTVELFELHDRARFEVHAFCWSRDDGTPFRERVVRAFDHVHRVGGLDDAAVARLIRDCEIDILVDLHGLTSGARPDIVAHGAAPVQITWLGFPGPTALPYVDWVVADDYVFPAELEPWFSEKPLRLPSLFQSSDSQRAINPTPPRSALGLPEDRFVYCAFNNTHKIRPEIFESWMRILRATGDSVLWLLADNPWAEANLRDAAMAHGIAPERLIFAGRVAPADYLGRFAAADLFLDTWPFNAGTTANDALWAGLPLLTLSGETYASRMAGSLLRSVGLTELITHSREDYERRAIELARDRAALADYRARLGAEKAAGRMFSTARFAREFEAALLALLGERQSAAATASREVGPASTEIDFDLEVEGWRFINHSYAIVNQFQLLEWARQPGVRLAHRDLPYVFAHWGKDSNPAGFDAEDAAMLEHLDAASQPAACVLRIHSPASLRPCGQARLGVFLVTEFGIEPQDAALAGAEIRRFEASGGFVVTPSQWSRARLISHGLSESAVHVVPHAASARYFHPLPEEVRQTQRASMGMREDEALLLNVGTALWNKGLDLLLRAFAIARQTRRDLRLLVKDQRHTYGIDGSDYIRTTLHEAGLLNEDVTGAITLIPANLDFRGLNALYNLADVYVSPYRAEGYNLPVREALACGTPVLVTRGGATDDFVNPDARGQIEARLFQGVERGGKWLDAYREPDLDHLIALLRQVEPKTAAIIQSVHDHAVRLPTWADACNQIRGIFCAERSTP